MSLNPAQACPDIDGLLDINCDRELIVVCFGNSITYGKGDPLKLGYPGRLQILLANSSVFNLGRSGEQTPSGKARAQRVFSDYADADYVVILEGVNDYFLTEPSPAETKSNLLAIEKMARSVGAVALLGNLLPVRRGGQQPWVEAVNRELSGYYDINFNSLGREIISSDKVHPNPSGYEKMSLLIHSELKSASRRHRPVDSDGDGVFDWEEREYGTKVTSTDSDKDGLEDGFELYILGSNPLKIDSDGDGISDWEEWQQGANPTDPRPGAPTLESIEPIL